MIKSKCNNIHIGDEKWKRRNIKKQTNKPLFVVILLSFLIIILLSIYIIYLRFIPYKTIEYDGYAVSEKK